MDEAEEYTLREMIKDWRWRICVVEEVALFSTPHARERAQGIMDAFHIASDRLERFLDDRQKVSMADRESVW